jgi:hypothetical protein
MKSAVVMEQRSLASDVFMTSAQRASREHRRGSAKRCDSHLFSLKCFPIGADSDMETLMSKGLGFVQRKIDQLFRDDPEGVFATSDLCSEVYHSLYPSKKQRVAIIRAAKAVAEKHPGIDSCKSQRRGGSWFWFHHDNVMSYAIARTRSDWYRYGPKTNQEARKELDKEENRALLVPGGTWWLFVQQWVAERDHDQQRLAELKPALDELEKSQQAWLETGQAMFGNSRAN